MLSGVLVMRVQSAQGFAAHYVDMEVENGLRGVPAVVENHAIAILLEAKLRRHFLH